MTTGNITPERAQECFEVWGDSDGDVTFNDVRNAFRTVIAQAAQIERVRKVADLLDQMAGDNARWADMDGNEYGKGKHDAYAKAGEILREVLTDTTPSPAPSKEAPMSDPRTDEHDFAVHQQTDMEEGDE